MCLFQKKIKNTLQFRLRPKIVIQSNLADLISGNLRSVTSFTRCYLDKTHLFPFSLKLHYFFRKRTGHPLKQRQRDKLCSKRVLLITWRAQVGKVRQAFKSQDALLHIRTDTICLWIFLLSSYQGRKTKLGTEIPSARDSLMLPGGCGSLIPKPSYF